MYDRHPATMAPDELARVMAYSHVAFFQLEPHRHVPGYLFVIDEEHGVIPLPFDWDSDAERAAVLSAAKVTIGRFNPACYAVWREVWMGGDGTTRPSEDPNRVEAVLTLVVASNGDQACLVQEIVRGEDGGVLRLKEPEAILGAGELTSFYPPSRAQH